MFIEFVFYLSGTLSVKAYVGPTDSCGILKVRALSLPVTFFYVMMSVPQHY